MLYIFLAALAIAIACGYADAKESDLCFRTGKAMETNWAIKWIGGPKPSFAAMMGFNCGVQAFICLPVLFLRNGPAIVFSCVFLAIRGAQHLTQAYWGMCLNTGRPTPKVAKWYQQLFWQHNNVDG